MAGSLLCSDANVLHTDFYLSCRSWLAALSAVSQQLSPWCILLQDDVYTSNWLSAIRHTPKLVRRIVIYIYHNELGCRAVAWQDTGAVNGPHHAVHCIHCNTFAHIFSSQIPFLTISHHFSRQIPLLLYLDTLLKNHSIGANLHYRCLTAYCIWCSTSMLQAFYQALQISVSLGKCIWDPIYQGNVGRVHMYIF